MINSLSHLSFYSPWMLMLLPLVWLAYYFFEFKRKSEKARLKFSSLGSLNSVNTWKTKLVGLPQILNVLALSFMILALARPRVNLTEESVKAEGIDIMLALDLSSSMLSKDFNPNRLEVAKKVAIDFVGKRKFDRIGLVVFSGEGFTQCPATTDHNILIDFIKSQQVGILEDGTAIGMGLATAVNRLKDSQAKSKVIILLTDGVNNAGYIDPITATEMALKVGVKVYTIGVGTEGVALSPVNKTLDGDYIFGPQQVNIDEQLLSKIAEETRGKYFRAKDEASLEKIYNVIDQLEKTEIETNVFKRYTEKYRTFLLVAAFALLMALFLKYYFLRTFP